MKSLNIITLSLTCALVLSTHAMRHEIIEGHPTLFLEEPQNPQRLLVLLNGLGSDAHQKFGEWSNQKDWQQWHKFNDDVLVIAINPPRGDWAEINALAKGLMALLKVFNIGEMGLEAFKSTYGEELDQNATALLSVIKTVATPHNIQEKDFVVAGQSLGGIMALTTSFKAEASFGAVADFCGPPMVFRPVSQTAQFTYILYDKRDPKLNIALFEDGTKDVKRVLPANAHEIVVRDKGAHTFGRKDFYTFWEKYMTQQNPIDIAIKSLERGIKSIPTRLAAKSSRQQRLERERLEREIAQLKQKIEDKKEAAAI